MTKYCEFRQYEKFNSRNNVSGNSEFSVFSVSQVCGASLIDSRIDPRQLELDISYRLPNNTSPILYDLAIETWVDKGRLNYNGSVNICVQVNENDTNYITLHSRNLNILMELTKNVFFRIKSS